MRVWFSSVQKLFWGLTLVLVGALLIGNGMILYNGSRLNEAAERVDGKILPVVNAAHEMKLAVVQVQQFLSDISATRGLDGLDDGFEEAEANAKRFRALVKEIDRLAPELGVGHSDLIQAFEAYYATGKRMAHAYVAGGPAAGNKLMGAFDATAEKLADRVDALLKKVERTAQRTTTVQKRKVWANNMLVLLVGSVVLAIVMLLYIVVRARLKALAALLPQIERMGRGDLSEPVKVSGSDEIGRIGQSMEQMRQQLLTLVQEIQQSSRVLQEGAQQLETAVTRSGERAHDQAQETQRLSEVVAQVAQSASEIAQGIGEVADAGHEARNEVQQGRISLTAATEQLQSLVRALEGTLPVIQQLEQQSEGISGILDVIRDIAEQTNLLALNAAIEAARAGEHGRGFAVVADEVRSLASRTQASTEEIQKLIETLVSGVNEAVNAMQTSVSMAQTTMTRAEQAGEAFANIVSKVNHISEISTQVDEAARKQSRVSDDMTQVVDSIRRDAMETSRQMDNGCDVTERIRKQLIQLVELVNRFRTDG